MYSNFNLYSNFTSSVVSFKLKLDFLRLKIIIVKFYFDSNFYPFFIEWLWKSKCYGLSKMILFFFLNNIFFHHYKTLTNHLLKNKLLKNNSFINGRLYIYIYISLTYRKSSPKALCLNINMTLPLIKERRDY